MLNLLSVALQGFAPGFKLSPIAIAVQGLITQLQEERRDDVRGGRGPARSATDLDPMHPPRQARDDVSVEEVLAKWELLELQLDAQRREQSIDVQRTEAPPFEHEAATSQASTVEIQHAGAVPQVAVDHDARPPSERRADDEATIIALLLAAATV